MENNPTKPCHQRTLKKREPICENDDDKCTWDKTNSKCKPNPKTPGSSLDDKVDEILYKISNIEKEITLLSRTQKNTLNSISPIEGEETFNMSTPSNTMNTKTNLNNNNNNNNNNNRSIKKNNNNNNNRSIKKNNNINNNNRSIKKNNNINNNNRSIKKNNNNNNNLQPPNSAEVISENNES